MLSAGMTTRVACPGVPGLVGSGVADGASGTAPADSLGASSDGDGAVDGGSSTEEGDGSTTAPAVVGSAYERSPAVSSTTPSAVRSAGSRRVRAAFTAAAGRPVMAAEW